MAAVEGRPFGGNVARLVAIQPAVERFLRVARVAALHEQARQVQPRGRRCLRGTGGELAARQSRAFLEPLADFP